MRKLRVVFKDKFWAISALLFGPWHAPLLVALVSRLTAGTAFGTYMSTHYNSIKSICVVVFSFYFVLAFMMWVVGRRSSRGTRDHTDETGSQAVAGLSIKQIVGWGLIGMSLIPVLVVMSALSNGAYFVETFKHIFALDAAVNAGLIWLISISMVIMVPTMVIWLVWMWRGWSHTDAVRGEASGWGYEYD